MYEQTPQEPINNNLVWAILATVLCCLPTGIYAIICASKVDGLLIAGKTQEARGKADEAKKWSIISAIIGVAGIVIYGAILVIFSAFGGMH